MRNPPTRLLLGPGPSPCYPQALDALAQPPVGHMDPYFLRAMDDLSAGLRKLFGTNNELTFAASGTGSAGMEMVLTNLVSPGDRVLVFAHGVFGGRMAELAQRLGGKVKIVSQEWGRPFEQATIISEVEDFRPAVTCLVHAETSTGVLQDLSHIGETIQNAGGLFVLDCVTSLGGLELKLDQWQVDAAFSGSQKCLSCPPGLAPVTFSSRAMAKRRSRMQAISSWYLDVELLSNYWGGDRAYHHTAPVNMVMALLASVEAVLEEGLVECFSRHKRTYHYMREMMGQRKLQFFVENESHRLPMLNTIRVDSKIDEKAHRQRLLEEFGIEVGGGLGPLAGQVWRVGLMGNGARESSVDALFQAWDALRL